MKMFISYIAVLLFWLPGAMAETPPAAVDTIHVAYTIAKPYAYSDEKEVFQGMLREIMDEVFTRELRVEIIAKHYPWARTQKCVENGTADIMVTLPTRERLTYSVATKQPLYSLHFYLYTYVGHNRIQEIGQIKNARDIKKMDLLSVSRLGNGWYKRNIASHGVRTHYITGSKSIFHFLALKRADIAIELAEVSNYMIEQLGLTSKLVMMDAKFGPEHFHILVGKKSRWSHRISEIDFAIKKLNTNGTIDGIVSKYR